MRVKAKSWITGDVFLVENLDHQYSVGQVLGFETRTLHSAACAFFDVRVKSLDDKIETALDLSRCFSTLLVTPDLLDKGIWKIVDRRPLLLPETAYPFYELFRKKELGGVIHGSGNVVEFLNAYHGLCFWDDWADPNYLDALLINPDKKPKQLMLKSK